MTDLTHGTWVVIADGEKALFLENRTDAEDPFLQVFRVDEQDNPPTAEQGTDRPGRMPDTGMGQRSAVQEVDWHRLAKERFADDLADTLYAQAHKGRFDRLVICAAPRVLGDLRDKLHPEVAGRVVAEIPKTLTNHPLDEVERVLRAELG